MEDYPEIPLPPEGLTFAGNIYSRLGTRESLDTNPLFQNDSDPADIRRWHDIVTDMQKQRGYRQVELPSLEALISRYEKKGHL